MARGNGKDKTDHDRKERDESIKAARDGRDPTPTENDPAGRPERPCPEGYPEETPADGPDDQQAPDRGS